MRRGIGWWILLVARRAFKRISGAADGGKDAATLQQARDCEHHFTADTGKSQMFIYSEL